LVILQFNRVSKVRRACPSEGKGFVPLVGGRPDSELDHMYLYKVEYVLGIGTRDAKKTYVSNISEINRTRDITYIYEGSK